jgi:hypothetical protein
VRACSYFFGKEIQLLAVQMMAKYDIGLSKYDIPSLNA